MEEQFNFSDLTPKTVIEIQAEQQKEYKLIGSIHVPRGLKLFEVNIDTNELVEVKRSPIVTADYQAAKEHAKEIADSRSKAMFNPKAIYVIALNKSNAYKKLWKMFNDHK